MDQELIFLTIVGMGLVTYLPRLLPILFLSGKKMNQLFSAWLRLVPAAVLSAMLLPSLLTRESEVDLGFTNLYLWVAPVAFFLAWRFKSLSLTVLAGMSLVALGRYLGWGS